MKERQGNIVKIAMIGHKRIPSREGGVEIVVESLAKRLVKMGHSVDAYNRKGKNVLDASVESFNKKEYEGVRLIWVPTFEAKSLNAMVYSLFATIRALFGRYDVIHYHAEGSCVMLPIAHCFDIRTVVTIHGLDWQRGKWGGFASKYIKLGERCAAKYADEVVVLSKNVQEYFRTEYQRETHYVPNGIEKQICREPNLIKQKYGLEKEDYILFLGRIVPEKGVHYLIEAYRELHGDKPRLVIAGAASHSDDYYEKIYAMAKDDENILFTGFVQGEALEELFSNCKAYVLPSDLEGMPISLLEAMAYGKPCVVSDIDEIKEVVGEDAFSFPKGDVQGLKRALETMLATLKESGFSYPEGKMDLYNWDKITEEYQKIYEIKL